MFWADNFTEAEHIGFVDTDTLFVAPVDRKDLFEGDKPVIIGLYGFDDDPWWSQVPQSTANILRQNEVLRCMSYFPMIIKAKHLRALREFILKTHGKNMNDFFQSMDKEHYSQFNIMCNYLWYHHRNEYAWYVQEYEPGVPGQSPGQVQSMEEAGIGPDMLYPKPRVSVHTNYHFVGPSARVQWEILALGYCYDALATDSSAGLHWCRRHNVTLGPHNIHMYHFELYSWLYHPKVQKSFDERQVRRSKCPRSLSLDLLEKANKDNN